MADGSSNAPKKMKFVPKIPPRKVPKPVQAKMEAPDDDDPVRELPRHAKENFGRMGAKVEKKYGGNESSAPGTDKDRVDEWDYNSYYPTVLPPRSPFSEYPEIPNELEFGEDSVLAYDKSPINAAKELDLMEDDGTDTKMLFFQLPASLPMVKQSASAKGKEAVDGSNLSPRRAVPEKACGLEELPAGFMGKMLVYKSGAIKMKLGDDLFDVSPGVRYSFAQEVAVINPVEKHCCVLGDLNKRAVVTPHVHFGASNLE